MPGDFIIPLCSDCEFRPVDPDSDAKVEGGLRIAQRNIDGDRAVVIYSEVDPRINNQYRLDPSADRNVLFQKASGCTPIVEGLSAGYGETEARIKRERKYSQAKRCPLTDFVQVDLSLPQDLLYQTELA